MEAGKLVGEDISGKTDLAAVLCFTPMCCLSLRVLGFVVAAQLCG